MISLYQRRIDTGLLIVRAGIGIMFMMHGWPKISGGVEKWTKIGGSMAEAGMDFAPAFWGFMAAFAEFGGGMLLVLGFLFLPATLLMAITMIVATLHHMKSGDGFNGYSHALEAAILFVSLMFTGPGRYSLDAQWAKKG